MSNFIGKFINLVTWFFLTPFILSQLGNAIYGLWILVGNLVAYGSLFNFGISGAIIKYVAEYYAKQEYDQAQRLITTALRLYSGLGFIVFLISLVLAPFFPVLFNIPSEQRSLSTALIIVSGLAVGLSIPCSTTPAILNGLQRFDLLNLISTIGTLLSAILMVIVLLSGGGVLGLVITSLSVNLLMQFPSIWLIHRIAPELRINWRGGSRSLVGKVISFSLPFFVLNLNGFLETKTDEIVIGANMPLASITPYNISLRLSSLPQMLSTQFVSQILPLSSSLKAKNDVSEICTLFLSGTRITLALFLPIGLIVCILANPILNLWVGPNFAPYSYLVVILTLASLIDTSEWPAGLILQGMARHRLLALVSLSSGVTNLILSIVLVRIIGLTGVAIGTLIPTTLLCFLFVFPYSIRLLGIRSIQVFKEAFFPAIIPALPMAFFLYILKGLPEINSVFFLLIVIVIGLVIYCLGFFSMKANFVERQALINLIKNVVRFARTYKHSI